MQGFEPSIDLEFENGFFKKALKLKSFCLKAFLPTSRWSRHTVKMQGIELAAILVAPSDFQNFFLGPSRAPEDPLGRVFVRLPWETPPPALGAPPWDTANMQ